MDISTYLRTQFEMYPLQVRDLCAFMADSDVREQLMRSPEALQCPRCRDGECRLDAVMLKNKELRYRYACNTCNLVSGELQKSASIAYWLLFAKKDIVDGPVVPLVRADRYVARSAAWHRMPEEKSKRLVIEWIASTKWLKLVWSKHRGTQDYASLSPQDQCYVDTIGAAIDVLRKDAVHLAMELGVDVRNENVSLRLKRADEQVLAERAQRFPMFKSKITDDFCVCVKKILGLEQFP